MDRHANRGTQLRPDVEGQEIVVMLRRTRDVIDDYDGDSYWSTVLVEDEDAEEGFSELTPTDEFEADEALLRATAFLEESYPSRTEIATACIEQGREVPDNIAESDEVDLSEIRESVVEA